MKNLAGFVTCDVDIQIELKKAKCDTNWVEKGESEVPYKVVGRVGDWVLTRAWTYWVAKCEGKGLPLSLATNLHGRAYPNHMFDECDTEKYGEVIRSGGHCGAPPPSEFGASIKDAIGKCVVLDPDGKEQADIANLPTNMQARIRESITYVDALGPEHKGYVDTYHIDTQEGLNEFIREIKRIPVEDTTPWISVKDRLPECQPEGVWSDSVVVWGVDENEEGYIIEGGMYNHKMTKWNGINGLTNSCGVEVKGLYWMTNEAFYNLQAPSEFKILSDD